MLAVVAVIAIISGLGAGVYVGTHKRMLVEKAARGFMISAKYGRILAIEKQRPYKIELDEENRGFRLVTTQWDEAAEEALEMEVRDYFCKPVVFEGDVRFEDIQIIPISGETVSDYDQNQSIVFSPDGTAQPVVIQIGDGRTHYSINISAATGRAKMYFGTADKVELGTFDLDAE